MPQTLFLCACSRARSPAPGASGDFLDCGEQRPLAALIEELVQQQLLAERSADAVVGAAVLLPGLHFLAVVVPEILRQLAHAV